LNTLLPTPKLHDALLRFLSERCTQDYVKTHVDALVRNVAETAAAPQFRDANQLLPFASLQGGALDRRGRSAPRGRSPSLAPSMSRANSRSARMPLRASSSGTRSTSTRSRRSRAVFGVLGEQDPLSFNGSAPPS
jgi:hypothetical protein